MYKFDFTFSRKTRLPSKMSAAKPDKSKYQPPKPSPLPADYDEFITSITPKERELFEIAKEKLGSSFFVQWTHLYKKWSTAKAAATKN